MSNNACNSPQNRTPIIESLEEQMDALEETIEVIESRKEELENKKRRFEMEIELDELDRALATGETQEASDDG